MLRILFLLAVIGLPSLYVFLFMPIIRDMLGPWSRLEANFHFLPSIFISFLLLYTWFNRVPEAGTFLRMVWRWGRWLLIAAYLWSLGILLWLNLSTLLRPDHRDFDALLVLAAIDIAVLAYLLLSQRICAIFAEFPEPVHAAEQRAAAKAKASARQQFANDLRLSVPVAQTPEQEVLEAHWRAQILSHPNSSLPWLELGVLAYQCGELKQALTLMKEAYSKENRNPLVLRNLCELFRQNGQFKEAIIYGRQAVEIIPNDEIARLNLAQALLSQGANEEATTQFHRMLDINPRSIQGWLGLCHVLLLQNRREDAKSALEAVLMIDPDNEQRKLIKIKHYL
jgi:tetratricopeptide (TPR) repeat protein